MIFTKLKKNKLKFNYYFKNFNLFSFNLNYNKNLLQFKKLFSVKDILYINKFKLDKNILKIQNIKSKIIKIRHKYNLIKLKYRDFTIKNNKQEIFTIYLNSPFISNLK